LNAYDEDKEFEKWRDRHTTPRRERRRERRTSQQNHRLYKSEIIAISIGIVAFLIGVVVILVALVLLMR
jgi:hypothetical protein